MKQTESLVANLLGSALCVAGWGFILYQGVVDPFGGINSLWPLFGISNQMLAGIALILASVVLVKMKRERYVWVTLVPSVWLLVCTLTAGLEKVFHPDPKIGFLAHAERFSDAIASGQVLAPAKTMETMERIVFNDYLNSTLACIFMLVVVSVLVFGVRVAMQAWRADRPTTRETPYEPQPATA